ncbi:antitoxin [Actinomycetospora straminea]|uniref:Antitoxin VapB29 n=1 Tax=Actinomycetospora straminea TaxID=663607 RepID=A0ABP9DXW2_9PSEU|nr:antitoxin [Actinomycetospora straminea]MDD7930878.1 antitoxin [Actinomycetospora straminea]
MRTTVDLPPAVHRQAKEIAERRGVSLSAVVAELAARGLIQLGEPAAIGVDERSGFPVVSIGRRVTAEDVAVTQDEE